MQYSTTWKLQRFTEKKICQFNYIVISFVTMLLSRKCLPKMCESKFLKFPHCVLFYLTIILQNFRETNFFYQNLVTWFHEKNWNGGKVPFTALCLTHCGNHRYLLSPKKNSSNQLFGNFFSKNVTFTKFLQTIVRVNFRNFHSVPRGFE